ncbi:LOW QUALITY PROTEIN: hypothetical protein OSB04_008042 [Centaurea solstitialis]|uniref:Amino acid transporter transmembrane domain-containing protein n=1 Tax=Centaurea solstitialis TaxID=347529 RepID=A0AA38WJ32_9ASTR|nr:LOW QUALITY PROTEIN: hypothetical protein OSB04_008042 [Centaurea solstitialis]
MADFIREEGDARSKLLHQNENTSSSDPESQLTSSSSPRIRTGTIWTAMAHLITGVMGAGVLSLGWSLAQLGWLYGITAIVSFAVVTGVSTYFFSDCYESSIDFRLGNEIRHTSFLGAVQSYLGDTCKWICAVLYTGISAGNDIGYTIAAATSFGAILRWNCHPEQGHDAACKYQYIIILLFGVLQIFMSHIPNFNAMSVGAAIISFVYSFICVGLGVQKVIGYTYVHLGLGSGENLEVEVNVRSVRSGYNRWMRSGCTLGLEAPDQFPSNAQFMGGHEIKRDQTVQIHFSCFSTSHTILRLYILPLRPKPYCMLDIVGLLDLLRKCLPVSSMDEILECDNGNRTMGSIGGVQSADKVWRVFQGLGVIAFAYPYSMVLLEIQDTLSSPPAETSSPPPSICLPEASGMQPLGTRCPPKPLNWIWVRRALLAPHRLCQFLCGSTPYWWISGTTRFIGVILNTNFITPFTNTNSVFSQPFFAFVEGWLAERYPQSQFVSRVYPLNPPFLPAFQVMPLRLCVRSLYVVTTTVIAMWLLPYFNQVLGILGALSFWPLSICFPLQMYLEKHNIARWTRKWVAFQTVSFVCFIASALALIGSSQGLISAMLNKAVGDALRIQIGKFKYKPVFGCEHEDNRIRLSSQKIQTDTWRALGCPHFHNQKVESLKVNNAIGCPHSREETILSTLKMNPLEKELLSHNETLVGDVLQDNEGFLASFMSRHDRGSCSDSNLVHVPKCYGQVSNGYDVVQMYEDSNKCK